MFQDLSLKKGGRERPGKNSAKKGRDGEKGEHLSCAPPCRRRRETVSGGSRLLIRPFRSGSRTEPRHGLCEKFRLGSALFPLRVAVQGMQGDSGQCDADQSLTGLRDAPPMPHAS